MPAAHVIPMSGEPTGGEGRANFNLIAAFPPTRI
jgi:hypothetical protein